MSSTWQRLKIRVFFEEVRTPGRKTTDPYSKERRKLSTSRNRISFELAVTKDWSVCDHNLQEIERAGAIRFEERALTNGPRSQNPMRWITDLSIHTQYRDISSRNGFTHIYFLSKPRKFWTHMTQSKLFQEKWQCSRHLELLPRWGLIFTRKHKALAHMSQLHIQQMESHDVILPVL